MLNFFAFMPVRTRLLVFALFFVIGALIIYLIIHSFTSNKTPKSEQPQVISNLQKVRTGEDFTPSQEKNLNIENKESSSEGKMIYSLKSDNPIRKDQIITQDKKVIFERIYIPEKSSDPNHLLISDMFSKYGQAEKVIAGSKVWGAFVSTYIYGSKGLAFIGNPNTNEVYEIQVFKPMSVGEYIEKYGDDIYTRQPASE